MSKYDELTDFNNDVWSITENRSAGNIDAASKKYLVECKESVTHNSLTDSKFLKQFTKYTDSKAQLYINVSNKKVILAIKEFTGGVTKNHKVLKLLEKKGVILITDLQQLKNLK